MRKSYLWLMARLSEKSTWATIFTVLATVIGVSVSPELADRITSLGMALVSFIAFITKEKK